jgi:hypothetical protein
MLTISGLESRPVHSSRHGQVEIMKTSTQLPNTPSSNTKVIKHSVSTPEEKRCILSFSYVALGFGKEPKRLFHEESEEMQTLYTNIRRLETRLP